MKIYNVGYLYGKKEAILNVLNNTKLGNVLVITNDWKLKRKLLKAIDDKYYPYIINEMDIKKLIFSPQIIFIDGDVVFNKKEFSHYIKNAEMIINIKNSNDVSILNDELEKRYIK